MNIIYKRMTLIILLAILPILSFAHHGWGWATGEEFEITGTITALSLGYPHGEVTIDANGEKWIVEVGQPYRNEDAGFADSKYKIGMKITVHGHRSAKKDERVVKAERVIIDGVSYDLYPDRKS